MGRQRETKSFLVVRMMSKRSIKIQSTDDVWTELVTGRDCCHSPKIEFSSWSLNPKYEEYFSIRKDTVFADWTT